MKIIYNLGTSPLTPLHGGEGDHGVRKYDYELGRFSCPDPLFEKYPGWTPYQYAANNPVSFVDNNGKEVSVFSEDIPTSTLAKGAGGGIFGWIQGIAANLIENPRHSFIMVTTDKSSTLIELGGPRNGSLYGTNGMDPLRKSNIDFGSDRVVVREHKVSEPEGQKSKYEFEEKVIENAYKVLSNLPKYDAINGTNSNGFVKYLIEISGGKVDLDTYKSEVTKGYTISAPEADPSKQLPCNLK